MNTYKVCVDDFEAAEQLDTGVKKLIKEEGDDEGYTLEDVVEYALDEAYENEEECVNEAYEALLDCWNNSESEGEVDEQLLE